jgi:uncharacterized membrane protein
MDAMSTLEIVIFLAVTGAMIALFFGLPVLMVWHARRQLALWAAARGVEIVEVSRPAGDLFISRRVSRFWVTVVHPSGRRQDAEVRVPMIGGDPTVEWFH